MKPLKCVCGQPKLEHTTGTTIYGGEGCDDYRPAIPLQDLRAMWEASEKKAIRYEKTRERYQGHLMVRAVWREMFFERKLKELEEKSC